MGKKKPALVSQFLEGISGAALEGYQEFFRDKARKQNGVYALYRGKRLYYVGLARDLRGRLKQHLKNRHSQQWDRFSIYLTDGDEHIRELESLVLRIVHPSGNRQIGKFPRAENLRREFARRVREDSKRRLDSLLGKDVVPRPAKAMKKRTQRAGAEPVLAAYSNRPRQLRATYKGKALRATVAKDGSILFEKERLNSPSLAAYAAIGRKRAINGWHFWRYQRAGRGWVRLDELRKG